MYTAVLRSYLRLLQQSKGEKTGHGAADILDIRWVTLLNFFLFVTENFNEDGLESKL